MSEVREIAAARDAHRYYRYLVQVGHHATAALLGAQGERDGGGKRLTSSAVEGGCSKPSSRCSARTQAPV